MQDHGVGRKQKSWKRCFCGSIPAKDEVEGEAVTPVKESGKEPENLPRRFSLKKSLSKLSSVSSNVSFYTARENADSVQSHSSRISQDSLAELDALGAEAEQSRTLGSFPSKKRSESINKKAELSPVKENEVSSRQNGHSEAQPGVQSVATGEHLPERATFLQNFDAANLKVQNTLMNSSAKCVADVPLLAVAPWNKRPGYLVSYHVHHSQTSLSPTSQLIFLQICQCRCMQVER